MTYSISVQGHGDEPYEEREATEKHLLFELVETLKQHGGHVSIFSFQGNEVRATTWDEAKAIAEDTGQPS